MKIMKELTMGGALPDLILTIREEVAGHVSLRSVLGDIKPEIAEVRILR